MKKPAETNHDIHELLSSRWSPRAFSDRPVEADKLRSLFEAARWAPSSANEQPWAFIVASATDQPAHAAIVETLTGRNPIWARLAPVLVVSLARMHYQLPRASGRPNRHAYYDVGQAVANLTVQATALGLVVHQMGGFDAEAVRRTLSVPDDYDAVTVIAIGYPGSADDLPDDLRERELDARPRRQQAEFLFGGRWGEALELPNDRTS
jgi:nitroreductase